MNNPEIKGTALIYIDPDAKEGLDSAKIYWLKKALNRMLKMILDSAKKLSKKLSPSRQITNGPSGGVERADSLVPEGRGVAQLHKKVLKWKRPKS